MPIITVIIPAYNSEKTIRETIESVLTQSFSDFEIIVINDGSTDSTLGIASSIQDQRIKVFSYPNAGPNPSRNRGLSHATGEYISFLDADDLWSADKLELQLKALQENPEAGVAYSWTDYINSSGNPIGRGSYFNFTGNIYANLLLADFIESGSNPLIRVEAIKQLGGFDESLPAAQDWDMWLRLAAHNYFVVVPSPQIFYRISGKSWSSNIAKMEAASLRVIERCLEQTPSLQHLKQDILGNRYKCLVVAALERTSGRRRRGIIAARMLWNAIKYDPVLIRTKVIWRILFKIAVTSLVPSQKANKLFTELQSLSDISDIFSHLRLT